MVGASLRDFGNAVNKTNASLRAEHLGGDGMVMLKMPPIDEAIRMAGDAPKSLSTKRLSLINPSFATSFQSRLLTR